MRTGTARLNHFETHAGIKHGSLRQWLALTKRLPYSQGAEVFQEGEGGEKLWLRNCRVCQSTLSRRVP